MINGVQFDAVMFRCKMKALKWVKIIHYYSLLIDKNRILLFTLLSLVFILAGTMPTSNFSPVPVNFLA